MEARDETRKLFLDIETTGTNRREDEVIEIAIIAEMGTERAERTWRFKPNCRISYGAQKAHGITIEDLEKEPPFWTRAEEIWRLIDRADAIIGYNVRFDTEMLAREFERVNMPDPFAGKALIDPYRIWQELEPRSLEAAYARFVGGEMQDAHSATADIAATEQVLYGMAREFGFEGATIEDMAQLSFPDKTKWIGPTSHFFWEDGRIMFGFGKLNERFLFDAKDVGYFEWILKQDFPPHVRQLVDRFLGMDMSEEAFNAWAEDTIGGDRAASMTAEAA